jgi:hypothetical protein
MLQRGVTRIDDDDGTSITSKYKIICLLFSVTQCTGILHHISRRYMMVRL